MTEDEEKDDMSEEEQPATNPFIIDEKPDPIASEEEEPETGPVVIDEEKEEEPEARAFDSEEKAAAMKEEGKDRKAKEVAACKAKASQEEQDLEEQDQEGYIGEVFENPKNSRSSRAKSKSKSKWTYRSGSMSRSRSNSMTTSRQLERMKQTKKNMPPQPGRVSPPPSFSSDG